MQVVLAHEPDDTQFRADVLAPNERNERNEPNLAVPGKKTGKFEPKTKSAARHQHATQVPEIDRCIRTA